MRNALGEAQTIVLFGGTSEIGRAIVSELLSPSTHTLVLACRRPDEANPERFARPGLTVAVEAFDAVHTEDHDAFVRRLVSDHGDLDVAIVAFGVLGSQDDFDADPHVAAEAVHVNYTGAVSTCLALAGAMRRQGHGHIAVVTSVAGERARAANYVYGSSKAGLDAFSQGLGDALQGTGVGVTVIRPGFVHSRMTRGRRSAPFATTPRVVGELAAEGMRRGRHTVWTPGILRFVFMALRHLPRAVFRRLPLR